MTARWCPSGGQCPSQRCRHYLSGRRCVLDVADGREHTIEEVAAALRVDERQIRRDEAIVFGKLGSLRESIGDIPDELAARKLRQAIAQGLRSKLVCNYSSSDKLTFLEVPRRFPDDRRSINHAPRVGSMVRPPNSPSAVLRRVGRCLEKERMSKTTTTTAEALVTAFEALELGAFKAEQVTSARDAIDADLAAAEAQLHPVEISPVPPDAIALYAYYLDRLSVARFGDELADLHARSKVTHPALAELCRRCEALADAGAAAAQRAVPDAHETSATAAARASAAAIARYKIVIARQLADVPGHELAPAARAYLHAVALGERLDASRRRHEAHAAAEQARAAAEREAAERAAAQKREAAEYAAELAIALRDRGIAPTDQGALVDAEREKIGAVVQLRMKLRRTKLDRLRVLSTIYEPKSLSVCVGDWDIDRCRETIDALDHAEAEARAS